MKKLSAFLLTTISVVVFAQSVSNYEYVFVPTKFKDFTENQYQLNSQLIQNIPHALLLLASRVQHL